MSHQATTWVMEFSESKLADRLVLGAIAHRVSTDNGEAYPSVGTIAREANVSERSVHYSIDSLKSIGELEVDLQSSRLGTNTYRLPKFLQWVQSLHPGGCKVRLQGVQNMVQGVHTGAPEPSLEPSVKQPSLTVVADFEPEEIKGISDRDLADLWKEMRRAYKRLTGKSLGTGIRGSASERFREFVEKHGQDKMLAGFLAFLDHEGKENLRRLRTPIFIFISKAEEWIDDAGIQVIEDRESEKIAGPRGVAKRYAKL